MPALSLKAKKDRREKNSTQSTYSKAPKTTAKHARPLQCQAPAAGIGMCVNCTLRRAIAWRNLCRRCHKLLTYDQRKKLPARQHQLTPRKWNTVDPAELPAKATTATPGSEAKIKVLIERAENREQLFRPDDYLSEPVSYLTAFTDMACRGTTKGLTSGVYFEKGYWRCRPWWGYRRFHLGCWRNREDAITTMRQWRELAAEIGPHEAMVKLRKRNDW